MLEAGAGAKVLGDAATQAQAAGGGHQFVDQHGRLLPRQAKGRGGGRVVGEGLQAAAPFGEGGIGEPLEPVPCRLRCIGGQGRHMRVAAEQAAQPAQVVLGAADGADQHRLVRARLQVPIDRGNQVLRHLQLSQQRAEHLRLGAGQQREHHAARLRLGARQVGGQVSGVEIRAQPVLHVRRQLLDAARDLLRLCARVAHRAELRREEPYAAIAGGQAFLPGARRIGEVGLHQGVRKVGLAPRLHLRRGARGDADLPPVHVV